MWVHLLLPTSDLTANTGTLRSPFFLFNRRMTSTPSTIQLDTELSAVNTILGSIGQSPITVLDFDNPEHSYVFNLLKEVNIDVQNEGWHFNTESHYKLSPDVNGHFVLPANVLQYDVTDGQDIKTTDVVVRNGRLYDKVKHTDVFSDDLIVDITWLFEFNDLPSVFQRYITYRAASRAATQLVGSSELVQLLAAQEGQARASCMEYECNLGDHSYMGWPDETTYYSYRPYHTLRR